jgi:hypothetical protein
MLYDVFICHASEDKDDLVRPLADLLRANHVEVWYDEFTLRVGDSIRRSIDRGLAQSRHGIVILSPDFLAKNWPQYELDGLIEREMVGGQNLILPVWHNIDHKTLLAAHPSLANRHAITSATPIELVVEALLQVIRPSESPLIIARDMVIEAGLEPPVITDLYWLEVVEAANRIPAFGASIPEESHWGRWSFPLPLRKGSDAEAWGRRLSWTALQLAWTAAADELPISVVTPPGEVHGFILDNHGLLETCLDFPDLVGEYAPQLTIPGYGGELEDVFEREYKASLAEHERAQKANPSYGTALTTDHRTPAASPVWSLRAADFSRYDPGVVSYNYFHADGPFGPPVSFHHDSYHLFWLLSQRSSWLPAKIRRVLTDGMKSMTRSWPWGSLFGQNDGEWNEKGALGAELFRVLNKGKFRWSKRIRSDLIGCIVAAKEALHLPETPTELLALFVEEGFVEGFLEFERDRRKSGRPT